MEGAGIGEYDLENVLLGSKPAFGSFNPSTLINPAGPFFVGYMLESFGQSLSFPLHSDSF